MPVDTVYAFRSEDLDSELLDTPFRERTNWRVIAGAPSCGKTTLIDQLSAHGHRILPESARAYLEAEIARGRTVDDIHRHGAALQRTLVDLQSAAEARLQPDAAMFLDGAIPLSLAWYRAFGLDPNEVLPLCFLRRYESVFLLDPLPLDVDNVRFDNPELVDFLDRWIARDFRALGYEVVRVPVLPPALRLDFVLDRLPAETPPATHRLVLH